MIGLSRLRSARLAKIGTQSAIFTEGNKLLYFGAHLIGDTDDEFQVATDACFISGLLYELQISEGVSHGARFFVEIRCRKDDIGELCCLCHKHLMDDDKGVLKRRWID